MLLEILDNFGLIFSNFCLCNSTSADKITKIYSNTQKYLHISKKSSTFAVAFGNFGVHNATQCYTTLHDALAIVAQLVEQRIRNAWVAGSSPASGSKQKKDILCGCLFCFATCPLDFEPLRGPRNARGVLGRSEG